MKLTANQLSLFTGIISYSTAVFMSLTATSLPYISQELSISICLCFTFLAHLDFFSSRYRSQFLLIDELFNNVVIVGVIAAIVAMLPNLLAIIVPNTSNWLTINVLPFAIFYAAFVYFMMCLAMFRKLIFERKTNAVIQQWRALTTLLIIAAFCQIKHLNRIDWITQLVWLTGMIAAVPLILRFRWIAIIEQREKWYAILYLFIINLISLAIIQQLIKIADNLPYFLLTDKTKLFYLSQNVFLLLIIGISLLYALLSLLALVFNMPIASAIDEQRTEIQHYQAIGRLVRNHVEQKEIFDQLLRIFYNNTFSTAAWFVLKNNNHELCHTLNIEKHEVETINKQIDFDNIIKNYAKRPYHYIADLRTSEFYNIDEPYQSLLLLCVESAEGRLEGVICLVKNFADGYDENSIRLCRAYLEQTKLAFENARLFSEMQQSTRYREELLIARNVQQALLPKQFPTNPYCQISAIAEPAREVGGDYYDYSQIDPSRLAMVVGDVSGKGTSAAFHMAQTKGVFQALMQLNLPADSFLLMANQALSNCFEKNRFLTLSFTLFNFANNTLSYSRAGHCPILYYSAKTQNAHYLQSNGLGLGIIRNQSYSQYIETKTLELTIGDVFVIYTDGLIEGNSPTNNEPYGFERLKDCLESCYHLSAQEIKTFIFDDYSQYSHKNTTKDDTTLLVIKIDYLLDK